MALLLAVVVAVLVPVPRLSAQQRATIVQRLVGADNASPLPTSSLASERALMVKYFPDVLRGEGPSRVVFLRDPDGRVTGTTSFRDVERVLGRMGSAVVITERPATDVSVAVEAATVRDLAHADSGVRAADGRIRVEARLADSVRRTATLARRSDVEARADVEVAQRVSAAEARTLSRADAAARLRERAVVADTIGVVTGRQVARIADSLRMVERRGEVDSVRELRLGLDSSRRVAAEVEEAARERAATIRSIRVRPDSSVISLDLVTRGAGELGPEPVRIYYLTRKH
jgi:hypothetical protein